MDRKMLGDPREKAELGLAENLGGQVMCPKKILADMQGGRLWGTGFPA